MIKCAILSPFPSPSAGIVIRRVCSPTPVKTPQHTIRPKEHGDFQEQTPSKDTCNGSLNCSQPSLSRIFLDRRTRKSKREKLNAVVNGRRQWVSGWEATLTSPPAPTPSCFALVFPRKFFEWKNRDTMKRLRNARFFSSEMA